MYGIKAVVLEGFVAFLLVYTVCAAADTRRGGNGGIGPLAVGLMGEANILAVRPLTGGGVVNPAYSFTCVAVSDSFKNQVVYWVGPLIGAATAAFLYDYEIFSGGQASSPPDFMISLEERF